MVDTRKAYAILYGTALKPKGSGISSAFCLLTGDMLDNRLQHRQNCIHLEA
jgi:hypothetical protein